MKAYHAWFLTSSDNTGRTVFAPPGSSSEAVQVDEHSRSNIDNIYAIGDVSTSIPLTPVARMEGTQFALHMFG